MKVKRILEQNIIIGVNCVEDLDDIIENLVSVEFVLENMRESEKLCESEKQVGKRELFLEKFLFYNYW